MDDLNSKFEELATGLADFLDEDDEDQAVFERAMMRRVAGREASFHHAEGDMARFQAQYDAGEHERQERDDRVGDPDQRDAFAYALARLRRAAGAAPAPPADERFAESWDGMLTGLTHRLSAPLTQYILDRTPGGIRNRVILHPADLQGFQAIMDERLAESGGERFSHLEITTSASIERGTALWWNSGGALSLFETGPGGSE